MKSYLHTISTFFIVASDTSTMAFLALPREIRDLIYTHLDTKFKDYTMTSTKAVTVVKASTPKIGILNTCKTTQLEMLEILSGTTPSDSHFRLQAPVYNLCTRI